MKPRKESLSSRSVCNVYPVLHIWCHFPSGPKDKPVASGTHRYLVLYSGQSLLHVRHMLVILVMKHGNTKVIQSFLIQQSRKCEVVPHVLQRISKPTTDVVNSPLCDLEPAVVRIRASRIYFFALDSRPSTLCVHQPFDCYSLMKRSRDHLVQRDKWIIHSRV